MKITSFVKNGLELQPVDVEVNLISGLPQIQIMGLPDTTIKESQLRIKSALKSQGYSFPLKEQVLVNLRPNDQRKSSKGLDLAIALAFLYKTNQLKPPEGLGEQLFIYGGLTLQGEIYVPDDLDHLLKLPTGSTIITGETNRGYDYPLYTMKSLGEATDVSFVTEQNYIEEWVRPKLKNIFLSNSLAEILKVTAVGEHRILFAGPAGSGKTTAAEALFTLLRDPNPKEFKEIQQVARIMGRKIKWRPFVAPHHTTPLHSMVGGGSPPIPGEVTRAHRGVLFLDELLEFKNPVRESLREPIEKGSITVSRLGKVQNYPARFQLTATSNLCPCGHLVPGRPTRCRYSLVKCRSYLERLSGPLLDRFEILSLSHEWKNIENSQQNITLDELHKEVQRGLEFQKKQNREHKKNTELSIDELLEKTEDFAKEHLIPKTGPSLRRKQALMRVARSFADLDESEYILGAHLDKATKLTILPFNSLERCFN